MATQQVTGRKSHRYRQIKHTQYAAAPVFCEEIRYKSWGYGDEGRFADPHQRVPNQQLRIGVRECVRSVRPLQTIAPSAMMSLRE